ncbi:MAG: YdeI/OmpD-associated family protein [Pleurocapsa minor GSE-CHR-MK-17-07R]|jgi:uncharacterized protein YdeI (YjbR/CyaY-like superfamily)|nr:YdeI/OmpD-associated family protein [Pleurocapsa minor GSE-CHR-MK 17-07R]
MAPVTITQTLYASTREEWRAWLEKNHAQAKEIWLITWSKESGKPSVPYLHAVEEALCFGWIDGIAKKMNEHQYAQRFTPRRPKSHWTELNKQRMRRLIAAGKMTPAGLAIAPDLSLEAFRIAPDILAALQADPETWRNFTEFPDTYQRIRVGYIEEVRRQPEVFQTRLDNFLKNTRKNKMYGVLE